MDHLLSTILVVDGTEWDLSNLAFEASSVDNDFPQVDSTTGSSYSCTPFEDDDVSTLGGDCSSVPAPNQSQYPSKEVQVSSTPASFYPGKTEIPECLDVDDIFAKLKKAGMIKMGRAANPQLEGLTAKQLQQNLPSTARSRGLRTTSWASRRSEPPQAASSTSNAGYPTSMSSSHRRSISIDERQGNALSYQDAMMRSASSLTYSPYKREKEMFQDASKLHTPQQERRLMFPTKSPLSARDLANQLSRNSDNNSLPFSPSIGSAGPRSSSSMHSASSQVDTVPFSPCASLPCYDPPRSQRSSSIRPTSHQSSTTSDRYSQQPPRRHTSAPSRSHRPSPNIMDRYKDERSSSTSQQQQQQQQHDNDASGENGPIMVEVTPGNLVRLRGSAETWEAIQQGRICRATCFCCSWELVCIQDADMVMCPGCRVISPVLSSEDSQHCGGGGLGLGMRQEEAMYERARYNNNYHNNNDDRHNGTGYTATQQSSYR